MQQCVLETYCVRARVNGNDETSGRCSGGDEYAYYVCYVRVYCKRTTCNGIKECRKLPT